MYNFIFFSTLTLILFKFSEQSSGDSSPYFQKCVERCLLFNCSIDSDSVFKDPSLQSLNLKLLFWSCDDECKYGCMWGTVDGFLKRKWRVPQFYGKWPFVRFYGVQEPASALFSIMNFYVHYRMLNQFRTSVNKDCPLYYIWNGYSLINMNAWIWSFIFHTRDTPFTEFMDYISAFSITLCSFYVMIIRFLFQKSNVWHITILAAVLAFYIDHIIYLKYSEKINYGFNMQLNIGIGLTTATVWLVWSLKNANDKPYVMHLMKFIVYLAVAMLLEILDFPPIFWVFDAHSLWHLATVPINTIIYKFAIEDCMFLGKEARKQKKE